MIYDQGPKSDNTEKSILLVKPWNSICNSQYRNPTLSGGAPLFHHVLVFTGREDVSCSLISLSIPCRKKLSCVKIYFHPCKEL